MDEARTQDAAKAKRDALIERIRKLQRMTTERGASENEAAQAAALVARLIAEHEVQRSELELRADAKNCIKDAYTVMRSDQPGWTAVCINIEKLYHTICWLEKSEEDILGLGFTTTQISVIYYGFPLDVAGSIATLAIVAQSLERELAKFPKRTRKLLLDSFEVGFCSRVNERIREMRARSANVFAGQGALVVVKDALVKEEFDKLGVKLHRSKAREKTIDAGAYAKGRAAGGVVPLDTQVGGRAQERLA